MKYTLALITALILTACGGGGGGEIPASAVNIASTETCATTHTLATNDHRSAILDLRYDDPGITAQGHPVNSFNGVKLFIDRIKCVGFSTVTLQTNIPISVATGLLNLSRPLPTDFWRIVEYAKSTGLKVAIKAIPVDHKTDEDIMSVNNPTEFFASLATYEKQLAQMAEAYKVDIFYIGVYQLDLDTDQYSANWDYVIGQIRSVYSGKLTYLACPTCDNVVWGKVDYISMSYDPNSISVDIIRNISNKYNKKINIGDIRISTASIPNAGDLLWQATLTNNIAGITNVVNSANYSLQSDRITSVFALGSSSRQYINGYTFGEYMPWSQAVWIQNASSSNNNNYVWKLFDILGFSLYNNASAQSTLKQFLSQPF